MHIDGAGLLLDVVGCRMQVCWMIGLEGAVSHHCTAHIEMLNVWFQETLAIGHTHRGIRAGDRRGKRRHPITLVLQKHLHGSHRVHCLLLEHLCFLVNLNSTRPDIAHRKNNCFIVIGEQRCSVAKHGFF